MDGKKYWIKTGNNPWREISQEEFIEVEKDAGFCSEDGCGLEVTAGFRIKDTQTRVTANDTEPRSYDWDPEFAALLQG